MPAETAVSEGGEDKAAAAAAAAAAAGAAEGEESGERSEAAEGDPDSSTPLPPEGASSGGKKITNQFNFSERASQTYNNPYRVRSVLAGRVITHIMCAGGHTVEPLTNDHP